MFNVNDTVMYGSQSVCKIAEITSKSFDGGKERTYYVLKPVYDDRSTIFVPVRNEKLTVKMHKVLSAKDIYKIIKTIPDEDTVWVDNDNARKEKYKEIINNGDRMELMKFIKTIYLQERKRKSIGKRLCLSDERFMKDAEKILYDEFALVLHIKRDQILPFVMDQLHVEEKQ